VLATCSDLVSFLDFISVQDLPAADEAQTKASSSSVATSWANKITPELLGKHPWLNRKVTTMSETTEDPPMENDVLEKPVPKEISDEAFEDLSKFLEIKRLEWASEGVGAEAGQFQTTILQGKSTMKLTGRAYNFCKGVAKTVLAKEWCRSYFGVEGCQFDTALYTERGAIVLAQAWVHKMEYFFGVWMTQQGQEYRYTAEDVAGWVPSERFPTPCEPGACSLIKRLVLSWRAECLVDRYTDCPWTFQPYMLGLSLRWRRANSPASLAHLLNTSWGRSSVFRKLLQQTPESCSSARD
jgi:hypothetical protein